MEYYVDESERTADIDYLLDWARLTACHVRGNTAGIEKYRTILEAKGEATARLQQLQNWRGSTAFTEREKAVLSLSESMSLKRAGGLSQEVLKEAKRHFNQQEMIRLTLGIMAVNEWINQHGSVPTRILVTEDDPQDRDLLLRQLQKARMENNVIFALDAHQALTVLEEYRRGRHHGDLLALFLDLRLPGMSGIELLRRVRAMQGMHELPVIVMTSSNDPRDMEECQKLKVASFVEKPITLASFSKAVANIFHQSTAPISLTRAGHCP